MNTTLLHDFIEEANKNFEESPTIAHLQKLGLEIKELEEDSLWVATYKADTFQYDLFVETVGKYLDAPFSETRVNPLLLVEGVPFEAMKEQRHSFFSGGGYVFYMNRRRMRLIMDYLDNLYEDG